MKETRSLAHKFVTVAGQNENILLEPSYLCVTFEMLQKYKGVNLIEASTLNALKEEDAYKIHNRLLWTPLMCEALPQGVDYFVFICGLYSSSDTVTRWLQYSCNLEQTGLFNTETLTAVQKQADRDTVLTLERLLRRRLHSHRRWELCGQVWTNYINNAKHRAFSLMDSYDKR